jgi:curved DNA-binding protein CbpA
MTLTRKIKKKNIKRKTRKQRGGYNSKYIDNFLNILSRGFTPTSIIDIDEYIVDSFNTTMKRDINEKSTFYEIYSIKPDASPNEIKQRYKFLAFKTHPDKSTAHPDVMVVIKEISGILLDEEKRIIYDDLINPPRTEAERIKRDQERLQLKRLKKEAERLEKERLEREQLEREEKERKEDEEIKERKRLEEEQFERERLEQERLERERLERERLERERLERERLERERLERERLERERLERRRARLERERARLERERLEKERLERERLEKELLPYNFTNTTMPIKNLKNTIINNNKKGLDIQNIVNNPDINRSKLIKPHFSLTGGRKTYNKRNRLKTTKMRR